MFDVILKNGLIVDGTGAPGFQGDLAIADGRIAAIGKSIDAPAEKVLDVSGLVVCPGFIECHTHSDTNAFTGSACINLLEQGSTTQIAGNCGSSPAPYYEGSMQSHQKSMTPEAFAQWVKYAETPASFMATARKQSYGTNFAFLIGHGALRGSIMGFSDQPADSAQLQAMKALLKQAMEAGFLGMSSGLVYVPSVYAPPEEIAELSTVMAPYGGIYTSHIRGEADTVIESVEEAIQVGRSAGVPVHISHLKVMGKHNEGMSVQLLAVIDKANDEGIQVTADQYPYNAGSAPLSSQLPPKYLVGGAKVWLEKIRDPEYRKKMEWSIFNEPLEFSSSIYTAGYEGTLLTRLPKTPQYINQTIAQIAKAENKAPMDVVCDLLIANDGIGQASYFNQNASDIMRIMAHPKVFSGMDASSYPDDRPDPEKVGGGHPRSVGTTVRRLELCRAFRIRTLEDAIHSMTGAPAKVFGLDGHGVLAQGNPANITVIDYDRLHANATYEHPCRKNDGIEYVFVNGILALEHGTVTGARAGKVITRKK